MLSNKSYFLTLQCIWRVSRSGDTREKSTLRHWLLDIIAEKIFFAVNYYQSMYEEATESFLAFRNRYWVNASSLNTKIIQFSCFILKKANFKVFLFHNRLRYKTDFRSDHTLHYPLQVSQFDFQRFTCFWIF